MNSRNSLIAPPSRCWTPPFTSGGPMRSEHRPRQGKRLIPHANVHIYGVTNTLEYKEHFALTRLPQVLLPEQWPLPRYSSLLCAVSLCGESDGLHHAVASRFGPVATFPFRLQPPLRQGLSGSFST